MLQPRNLSMVLAFVLLSSPAFSQLEIPCTTSPRPAATLLFPYFEIDADDPKGKTTLISIRNISEAPVLANVVVWSKCTVPVLDFPILLGGRGVTSLDLRRLLVEGKIPATGAEIGAADFPGCSRPLLVPELDSAEIDSLLAALAGQTDPPECGANSFPDPTSHFGFLTVDVLNDCSDELHTPLDNGYFESGGKGLASNANVLWGDFLLLDKRSTSSAFGIDAVSIVADAARFAAGFPQSFYSGLESDRLPLDTRYSARFLNGVGPDTRTEVLLWLNPFVRGSHPSILSSLSFFNEQGEEVAFSDVNGGFKTPLRVPLDELTVYETFTSEGGPLDIKSGSLEIDLIWDECPVCSPALFHPHQAWVVPLYSGLGGLSAELRSVQQSPFCELAP